MNSKLKVVDRYYCPVGDEEDERVSALDCGDALLIIEEFPQGSLTRCCATGTDSGLYVVIDSIVGVYDELMFGDVIMHGAAVFDTAQDAVRHFDSVHKLLLSKQAITYTEPA